METHAIDRTKTAPERVSETVTMSMYMCIREKKIQSIFFKKSNVFYDTVYLSSIVCTNRAVTRPTNSPRDGPPHPWERVHLYRDLCDAGRIRPLSQYLRRGRRSQAAVYDRPRSVNCLIACLPN